VRSWAVAHYMAAASPTSYGSSSGRKLSRPCACSVGKHTPEASALHRLLRYPTQVKGACACFPRFPLVGPSQPVTFQGMPERRR
jgi:hypothetical protein